MQLSSQMKRLGMVLLAAVLFGLWLIPSYSAPDKQLILNVSPATISFIIDNPEVSGPYYAVQEVVVTSYHNIGNVRRWGIFINAELPYLIDTQSNQRIPISNLEWSIDGVTFNKCSTGKVLVKRHEGRKNQMFEDRIYYRLLFDANTSPGSYLVTINFDAVWGEVYTDLDQPDPIL